jgi:hypothetical protein
VVFSFVKILIIEIANKIYRLCMLNNFVLFVHRSCNHDNNGRYWGDETEGEIEGHLTTLTSRAKKFHVRNLITCPHVAVSTRIFGKVNSKLESAHSPNISQLSGTPAPQSLVDTEGLLLCLKLLQIPLFFKILLDTSWNLKKFPEITSTDIFYILSLNKMH